MSLFRRSAPDATELRLLKPDEYDSAIEWMNRRPGPASFVLGWLHRFGNTHHRYRAFYQIYVHGPAGDWDLLALVANGALVSIVAATEEGGYLLGKALRRQNVNIQTLVGPDDGIIGLQRGYLPPTFRVRVNQKQRIMMRTTQDPLLPTTDTQWPLVKARAVDISDVIVASLAMHEEEIRGQNSPTDIEALERSATMKVKTGRSWIVRDAGGRLIFKASTSLPAPSVIQIEGVWTDPSARRHQIAYRSLLEICHQLHRRYPAISLTVGRDNHAAIRLYERLHFHEVDTWRTVYIV